MPNESLVDHQRLGATVADQHWPNIFDILLGASIVAEAVEPARLHRSGAVAVDVEAAARGDVQVRAVPQAVGLGLRARVEHRAGVDPLLGAEVEPVDVVVAGCGVEDAAPPAAVVEPELALGLLAGRRLHQRAAGRAWVVEVGQVVVDIAIWRGRCARHRNARAALKCLSNDQAAKHNQRYNNHTNTYARPFKNIQNFLRLDFFT